MDSVRIGPALSVKWPWVTSTMPTPLGGHGESVRNTRELESTVKRVPSSQAPSIRPPAPVSIVVPDGNTAPGDGVIVLPCALLNPLPVADDAAGTVTAHDRLAGLGSSFPARSFALTSNV